MKLREDLPDVTPICADGHSKITELIVSYCKCFTKAPKEMEWWRALGL